LPDNVKTVSNEDGIPGGVKVWDKKMAQCFTETLPLNIVHERKFSPRKRWMAFFGSEHAALEPPLCR
jgi:hypothetical protein